MKLISFKTVALALSIVVLPVAKASLLIEPHVGFNVSGSGTNDGADDSYNGGQLGLKLGYQTMGFMLGLDYTKSSFELESKDNSGTTKTDMSRNEIGVFAGYDFPVLARVWAGYYFSNTTKIDNTSDELTGNTKELGVGFKMLPLVLTSVNLNFIYRMVDLDEYNSGGVKSKVDLSYKEFVVGISLPFTL